MVSIITINYNGWKDTCELIESFKQYETYPYEFIVVDNASKGDDVERLRKAYPDLKLVVCDKNLGFAGGNNAGMKHASGEYLFFLNNDTVIKAPVLKSLVDCFADPTVGGVSPLLRFAYPPNDVQYCGWKRLTTITLKNLEPATADYNTAREIEVMHGAAMMIPRRVVDDIGLMPECYFLYYEEYDWSYTLFEKGYKIRFEPAATIYHKEGTKKGLSMSPFREYYMTRARILFSRRHSRGINKALSCLYLALVAMPLHMLNKLRAGKWESMRAVWSGTMSGLSSSTTKTVTRQR